MKKILLSLFGVLLVAAGAIWLIKWAAGSRVSLDLVGYRRWPHGAMLRLSNHGKTPVHFLSAQNYTPAGAPVLRLEKSSEGWTNRSLPIRRVAVRPPAVRNVSPGFLPPGVRLSVKRPPPIAQPTDRFFIADPNAPPKPGDRVEALIDHELLPGRSVDFFVRLQPGAPPIRVGTFYYLRRGPFMEKLQPAVQQFRKWFGIKPGPTRLHEVWHSEPLRHPDAPEPVPANRGSLVKP